MISLRNCGLFIMRASPQKFWRRSLREEKSYLSVMSRARGAALKALSEARPSAEVGPMRP